MKLAFLLTFFDWRCSKLVFFFFAKWGTEACKRVAHPSTINMTRVEEIH